MRNRVRRFVVGDAELLFKLRDFRHQALVVALEVSQAIEKFPQYHQPATHHHHENQGQRYVQVLVKTGVEVRVATGGGAQGDHLQEYAPDEQTDQNQHHDKGACDVQQRGKSVVLALTQVEQLGIDGKQPRLQD